MTQRARIRNPKDFDDFHLYTRTISRESENYKELTKRIGREVSIIYPNRWYDWDIDRVIASTGCVHHGIQELKYVKHIIRLPFKFPPYTRRILTLELVGDNMKIEYNTLHFSLHDRKGVFSKDDEYGVYPTSRSEYKAFLREKKRVDKLNNNLGKGVFLFVFHTRKLKYFSVVNFTGSEYVLGEKRLRHSNHLEIYLEHVSKILEPCFNELLLFMLEAYVRQDFYTLCDYLTQGQKRDHIRLADHEKVVSDSFKEMGNTLSLWFAFQDVMEWLLESIHFDTILEEAVGVRKPRKNLEHPSYMNLVELCQSGEIFEYLAERIRRGYEYHENSRRRAS